MTEPSGLLRLTELGVNVKLNMRQKLAIRIAVLEQYKVSTPYDTWFEEICQLRFRVAELEKQVSDLGWQLYPESMGR